MNQSENRQAFLGLTAEVISAHVKNNHVDAADLPLLIEQVYHALRHAGAPVASAQAPAQPPAPPEPEKQIPVVSIKKSVFPDYIICLEDGRKMKTLKRYLRTTYSMTPEQYREKWGLPADYPMVAPSYAEHRSVLAKQTGLGRKPAAPAAVAAAPIVTAEPVPAPSPAPPPPCATTPRATPPWPRHGRGAGARAAERPHPGLGVFQLPRRGRRTSGRAAGHRRGR